MRPQSEGITLSERGVEAREQSMRASRMREISGSPRPENGPGTGVRPDRPIRVGLIAPCAVTVPPPNYGGTEMVVDILARGLAELGHEPVLFTVGDSTCPVERRWSVQQALGAEAGTDDVREHAEDAYGSLTDVDVIHDHTEVGPLLTSAHPTNIPLAATVHGDCETAAVAALVDRDPRVELVAISRDQRASAPQLGFSTVIHHGVETERYAFGNGDGGYVLFLGRMAQNKGAHRAIKVARAADRRILIAAKNWEPAEHEYFREQVEPLLGSDAEFLDEVGFERKVELLAGAEALINPIRWREPFGLVMIEALACGTPVLAFPEGAAPEIVDDGVTGFLCETQTDMAHALERVPELSRQACREQCVANFSKEHMVNKYVELYQKMLAR